MFNVDKIGPGTAKALGTVLQMVVWLSVMLLFFVLFKWLFSTDTTECMKVCGERGVTICEPPVVRCEKP